MSSSSSTRKEREGALQRPRVADDPTGPQEKPPSPVSCKITSNSAREKYAFDCGPQVALWRVATTRKRPSSTGL